MKFVKQIVLILVVVLASMAPHASAQTDLKAFPNYDRYQAVQSASRELARQGRISAVQWSDDGRFVSFRRGGERVRFDLEREAFVDPQEDEAGRAPAAERRSRNRRPGRGRQRDVESSPNGRWTARSADWNVTITDNESDEVIVVTTDGWRKFRYGTASWVYGEELDQRDAMWWSPNSRFLAFYEFDERDVPDHHLVTGWTDLHTEARVEGFPKPGEANPVPGLIIYNIETGTRLRIDAISEPDQYVYRVAFTEQGDELLFSRTNRRQNVLEVVAADVETGAMRIVVMETQDTWQDNRPTMRFLDDGRRFVWRTERTGFAAYELRHLDGRLLAELMPGNFPTQRIEWIDENRNEMWFTTFSGDHPLNAQFHRVGLDGEGGTQLTDRDLNHTSFDVSPDGNWFIATFESLESPATTALHDRDGHVVVVLAEVEQSTVAEAPFVMPELFRFTAADGETMLYGVLFKPSNFDPTRSYPLLIDVYGGPYSKGLRNRFTGTDSECEFGYLVAKIENRGTVQRGKAFESATYLKLGDVDLADQVSGVRHLVERAYVDGDCVAIAGHSYGGFMAALAILKYPDVFAVAIAGASVTDWRQYDSIYTERYMRTPKENEAGYDAGSCMTYAAQLQGHLLLQHGLLDNNVHANNTFALNAALHKAGKLADVSIYPDRGHSLGIAAFIERLRYLHEHLLNQTMSPESQDPVVPADDVVY